MFRFVSTLIALVLMLALAVPTSACGHKTPEAILFGCALTLSGKYAETGRLVRYGYELWMEKVNSRGGISVGGEKHQVNILYYDDESSPDRTALYVRKLIITDKVDFLLGPYGSASTLEAARVAEEYGVPMVQGGGAADGIFSSGFTCTFGLLNTASDYFGTLLHGATSLSPRPNKVAIVSADDDFSQTAAKGAKELAEQLGFNVLPIVTFLNDQGLSAKLEDLKWDHPDMVLLSSHFPEALTFMTSAKGVDLNPSMYGIAVAPADPGFIEALGQDANYVFGTAQWLPSLPYSGKSFGSAEEYALAYEDEFGVEPDYHSAAATACGLAFQFAIEQAGSLSREDVRQALASLDVQTFYGQLKFDETGRDSFNPMVALQVQDGKIVAVWPDALATAKPLYPTPPWDQR